MVTLPNGRLMSFDEFIARSECVTMAKSRFNPACIYIHNATVDDGEYVTYVRIGTAECIS